MLNKLGIDIKIKLKEGFEYFGVPVYGSEKAAGVDLYAAIENPVIYIQPGQYKLISAGFSMALPEGYEAQIRPRSGMAFKHGVTVLNSPGTIDADYRGDVGVILINHGSKMFKIEVGMRIAQMIVSPVTKIHFNQIELCKTKRGQGGYGSTGK